MIAMIVFWFHNANLIKMTIFVKPLFNSFPMDKNRISIIIPVYNAEDYLSRCLDSILDQSFTSYEVILVDDGSTDSSPLLCDRYSSADARFRTIHKENAGVSAARNAGINLAKGEYVMFVDADDALLPEALERMMEGAGGEDILIGGYAVFVCGVTDREIMPLKNYSYKGTEMSVFFEDNMRHSACVMDSPWSKMFRRKAIGNLRFKEDLSYAEDKLFMFDFLSGCSSVYTCKMPVYAFHLRPDALGSDIASDRHLIQLRRFIPAYVHSLNVLTEHYPASSRLNAMYHKDVVGCYAFRILDIFRKRKTDLLDKDYLEWVYALMDADDDLGLFSFGFRNLYHMLLYRIRKPSWSIKAYRMSSFLH